MNQHVAFNVEGMTSEQCAQVIREALCRLNGVCEVIVDIDVKRVAVEYDAERLDMDTMKGTIEDSGFKVK